MDSVFDAQFRNMRDAFLAQGVDVRVAYRPDGEVDYLYQAGRILTRQEDLRASATNLATVLPGIEPVPLAEASADQAGAGGVLTHLRMWSIENLRDGRLTVPEALELIDRRLLRGEGAEGTAGAPGQPVATPVHVLHISPARSCPAVEPSVPSGYPMEPWPPLRPVTKCARRVKVGVSDTGFLAGADLQHSWLSGVSGQPDDLGPLLPGGRHLIPEYCGHGTFIAGVIRSVAADTDIFVADHFPASGAWLETEIVAALERLLSTFSPDVISLSAGSYARDEWEPLCFSLFHELYPDVLLVAAAGNEATDRPFYPAAFDWAVGVGALGTDQAHRAWFSNYGPWVDVYAVGEGMVNAYAKGTYEYQEPPRRPAKQDFDGMARWDGTSFSTPLVTGLIAAEMSADPTLTARKAWQAVLARAVPVTGAGPSLIV
jgi:hypothetical protein